MVLTFTGSLSVADSGRDDVRMMLIGALGCNIAWGVIDGIFYLMECISEQGLGIRSLRAVRKAANKDAARQVLVDALPPIVAATLTPADYESMHQKLLQMPEPPARPRLGKSEWLGALAVFFWVFIITFPVAIPFIFMEDLTRAMRFSNAIAIGLLFATGFAFGRVAQYRPWLTGLAMVVIGSVLVSATIALGG
jgi:VIT1/CCC1 family predicted Fe2+/Mn2+ transporter